jgi:hypothetical protein
MAKRRRGMDSPRAVRRGLANEGPGLSDRRCNQPQAAGDFTRQITSGDGHDAIKGFLLGRDTLTFEGAGRSGFRSVLRRNRMTDGLRSSRSASMAPKSVSAETSTRSSRLARSKICSSVAECCP